MEKKRRFFQETVLLSLRVQEKTRNFQHVGGARIVIMSHASFGCKQFNMATSMTEETSALTRRLSLAEVLLSKAAEFRCGGKIQGMQRVEKQIKAEISMLNKLLIGDIPVKKHHVNSTNLLHLEGVLHLCEYAPEVVAVERTFRFSLSPVQQVTTIDVISNGGSTWVKMFARKRSALHKKWQGDGNFGDKTVTDFAQDYIQASKENLHNFSPPNITFVFFDGVTESIADELHQMDISVLGPVYPDKSEEEAPSPLQIAMLFRSTVSAPAQPILLPVEIVNECSKINLDVSSMLGWVSSITHTSEHLHFDDRLLQEQALQEAEDPLWPKLQAATNGKMLIVCYTAIKDFKSIVSAVGGKLEQERARKLLSIVQEVPDQPSERALKLRKTGKIKDRPKVIFGTGDQLKAITLTANEGFVRSAAGQGVHFSTIVHQSRALAELEQEREQKRRKDSSKRKL